jgi:lysophospholipase L1-like esterase
MNRRGFIAAAGAAAIAANAAIGKDSEREEDSFKEIKALLNGKEPIVWVFTGDSITHGALHTFGHRSYVEHFAERVRWELRRMTDVVINTGISGDTMKGILARDEWRIFQFKPKVVSLKIGMNDCRDAEKGRGFFRDSLEKLVEKARQKEIALLLHTPNLIHYPNAKERVDLPGYVDIIREVASKHKVPLVDHYAYWSKEVGTQGRLQMLLNDGSIHPNAYGHLLLARKMFQDLGVFDANSQVCKLFVP